jgi:hypothetical protein
LLEPTLGKLSLDEIREQVSTAAASHLLWNIMFAPGLGLGDVEIRVSITEKEAWEIALREQYWPYAKFEIYLQELVEARFLCPAGPPC